MALGPDSVLFAWSAGGNLSNANTLTRLGDATYRNRQGLLAAATCDQLRIQWEDIDGDGGWEQPTLLMERASTNGFEHSEDFSRAEWSKSNVTVTANAGTAPDGTTTADYIVETTDNAGHNVNEQGAGIPTHSTDTLQAVSVFAKRQERDVLRIRTQTTGGSIDSTYYDLTSGAIGTQSTDHTAFMERWGNDWYRCSAIFDSSSGVFAVEFFVATSDGDPGTTGSTDSGLLLWGAQYESDLDYVSSYIATSSSGVSRGGEVLDFPLNFGVQDVTLYTDFIWAGEEGGNARIVMTSTAAETGSVSLGMVVQAGTNRLDGNVNDKTGTWWTISTPTTLADGDDVEAILELDVTNEQVRVTAVVNDSSELTGGYTTGIKSFGSNFGSVISIGQWRNGSAPITVKLKTVKLISGLVTLSEARNIPTAMGA